MKAIYIAKNVSSGSSYQYLSVIYSRQCCKLITKGQMVMELKANSTEWWHCTGEPFSLIMIVWFGGQIWPYDSSSHAVDFTEDI